MPATKTPEPAAKTSAFIRQQHGLLINGEWVAAASGKRFEVRNPATEEILTTVAEGDREDINKAVADLTDDQSPSSASAQTLESLTDRVWAKHNAQPKKETTPDLSASAHHDGGARQHRGTKPKTLDDISASAWRRFNNPPRGSSLRGDRS